MNDELDLNELDNVFAGTMSREQELAKELSALEKELENPAHTSEDRIAIYDRIEELELELNTLRSSKTSGMKM